MLTLEHPWWLALLIGPWIVWRFVPPLRVTRSALAVPFLDRLSRISGDTPAEGAVVPNAGRMKIALAITSWCCAVLAMTRPQWIEPPIERTIPVRDLLLAIDLSGSMQTRDFTDEAGQTVDRLTAVKEIVDAFLARRKGDRVGLIVFGNAPFVQSPFTDDLDVCRRLLAATQVGMAGQQTAFGDALGLAINVFDKSTVKDRVLIAMTDGNDTASQVPPAKAAEIAKDKGIVIHTIAIGDPHAAGEDQLDEKTLQQIASTTDGLYSHGQNRDDLKAIYAKLDQLETRHEQTLSHRPRRDLYHWPLGCALLLSLAPYALACLPYRREHVEVEPQAVRRSAA